MFVAVEVGGLAPTLQLAAQIVKTLTGDYRIAENPYQIKTSRTAINSIARSILIERTARPASSSKSDTKIPAARNGQTQEFGK